MAILVFVVLWLWMAALTLQRFNAPGLSLRMDVTANVLAITANEGETLIQLKNRIQNQAIAPATHFQWQELPGEPPSAGEERHQKFLTAAADLAKLDPAKPSFAETFALLDPVSKTFSDRPLIDRPPSVFKRVWLSYYTVDGVHFRELEDFSSIRHLATDYLRFRQRGNELHGWSEIVRPWGLLEFYDPKRAELNDLLPVVSALLILISRFLLSYRYYDIFITKSGRNLFIHSKSERWIPLWEHSLIVRHEEMATGGYQWCLALGAGIGAALALEFKTDDPEVWTERFVNIFMMVITGALFVVILAALMSLMTSLFSSRFRSMSLRFRGRILLPLTITLAIGVTALAGWIAKFSWDQLMTRPLTDMSLRGEIQLGLSAVLEILALATLFNLFRRSPGAGPDGNDEDDSFNKPDPGCLSRIGISTDEKLLIALAVALAPWIAGVKEMFFS
jgi:hypothetical protein